MDATGATSSHGVREPLPGVVVCADAAAVAREAATRFVDIALESIAGRAMFAVALAGGSTPRELYRLLASDEFRDQVDWNKLVVFWGDERAVPPDHPDSNFGLANETLLQHVPIPAQQIHRMAAERQPIGRAAADYERKLETLVLPSAGNHPRFDLIVLGMGADGHTASLFPGTDHTQTSRWVTARPIEKLGAWRMSFTLPVLNAARHVLFLITGEEKAATLGRVLNGPASPDEAPLPAQLVQPVNGQRVFLVDEAAAREFVAVGTSVAVPPAQEGTP